MSGYLWARVKLWWHCLTHLHREAVHTTVSARRLWKHAHCADCDYTPDTNTVHLVAGNG